MANSLNTITVDGVTYNADAYAATQTKDAKSNNLDKDAFLQLLVAQLKYQDPLQPEDNNEFISQMAQFSSLEQMTNMTEAIGEISQLVSNIDTSVLVGQLSGMIGKGVEWLNTSSEADENGAPVATSTALSGVITGVTVASGVTKIIAETSDGQTYQVDVANIAHVYEIANNKTSGGVSNSEISEYSAGDEVGWSEITPTGVNAEGSVTTTTESLSGILQEIKEDESGNLIALVRVNGEDTIRRIPIDDSFHKVTRTVEETV